MNRHQEVGMDSKKEACSFHYSRTRSLYLFTSQHSPSGIMENNHAQQIICCQTLKEIDHLQHGVLNWYSHLVVREKLLLNFESFAWNNFLSEESEFPHDDNRFLRFGASMRRGYMFHQSAHSHRSCLGLAICTILASGLPRVSLLIWFVYILWRLLSDVIGF